MKDQPLIATGETKFLALAEEAKFTAAGIVSRTLLNTAHSLVILFGLDEGQELGEPTSKQHALIQILGSECDAQTRSVSPHGAKFPARGAGKATVLNAANVDETRTPALLRRAPLK